MVNFRFPVLSRCPWLTLFGFGFLTLFCLLSAGLFLPYPVDSFRHALSRPKSAKEEVKKPDFYNWKTRSPFEPVQMRDWQNTSTSDLCASFPSYLLNDIQPVLKTGHGVLEDRVRPQLNSTLACLDSILTFSDVTEQFENLHFIDVLEDVPQDLVDASDQLDAYRRFQACLSNDSSSGDCTDVLAPREAWNMDKFKFLPMATRAWKMRPEWRWYVFFEADTILFWDNIFRLVSNFDADVPLYFGSPSPGRAGTWFAYGGSGFILNRGAVKRLVADDWDKENGEYLGSVLTREHWDTLLHDCCGDSVLGWALHTKGVDVSGLWPMFNPHPPHGVPFSKLYWCQPMLGMHKPHTDDMKNLFRWEYGYRQYDRPLVYRDLAVDYYKFPSLTERKEDWDNAGWNAFRAPPSSEHYSRNPDESPEACGSACESHPDCMQWTHQPEKCTFVRSIRYGRQRVWEQKEAEAAMDVKNGRYVAGWATERIKRWIDEHPCDKVQWVTPSIERIF